MKRHERRDRGREDRAADPGVLSENEADEKRGQRGSRGIGENRCGLHNWITGEHVECGKSYTCLFPQLNSCRTNHQRNRVTHVAPQPPLLSLAA